LRHEKSARGNPQDFLKELVNDVMPETRILPLTCGRDAASAMDGICPANSNASVLFTIQPAEKYVPLTATIIKKGAVSAHLTSGVQSGHLLGGYSFHSICGKPVSSA
jgi:hypothetical protein